METTPRYAPIPEIEKITGLSRRVIYERLGTGELKAIKVGARTLIDVQAALAWLGSLPPAVIKAPRERQSVDA